MGNEQVVRELSELREHVANGSASLKQIPAAFERLAYSVEGIGARTTPVCGR